MTKKERIMEKLFNDVTSSFTESVNLVRNTDDGGTCNFDSCMIKKVDGITYAEFEETMKKANCRVSKPYGSGYRGWYLIMKIMGQGYRNTLFAETLRDKLKSKGYETSVWYQMD